MSIDKVLAPCRIAPSRSAKAAGRSLSLWTCAELARSLREAEAVDSISPQSVQRILESHKLKPWRVHYWLSPDASPQEKT